jgi:hypothetical protein
MGVEEEEVQTKGIDNLFHKIMQKTSLISRVRGTSRYRRLSVPQTGKIRKETLPQPYYD